jgi:hypothetical protein
VEKCREERTVGGACPDATDWAPTTFQGAYVIYLDGDATKSFRVHGRITHEHLSGTTNVASDTSRVMWGLWGGWGWRSSLRRVYRSIFMDGLLYTLSDRHMQVLICVTLWKLGLEDMCICFAVCNVSHQPLTRHPPQAHRLDTMEELAMLNMTMPTCYPASVWANSNPYGGYWGEPIAMP